MILGKKNEFGSNRFSDNDLRSGLQKNFACTCLARCAHYTLDSSLMSIFSGFFGLNLPSGLRTSPDLQSPRDAQKQMAVQLDSCP
jgi:hypothetical protein